MEKQFEYDLTVVIVNYNVEFFLDQCLNSVQKASKNLEVETIVVDNNSVDGSMEMAELKYPWAKKIINTENVGFSKANNQAIEISKGEFVLLLNPDTVVSEDTFEKTVNFLKTNSEYGGLGVRMIDGKGEFLPESKRGLPKPMVAFYKIFGISKLFPKSKKFGQYHAGHISETETAEIDVLSGAFMLLRKETLNKIGLLDETFFMYGEDIDLSYRIQLGGYKNVYFADTSIIHYKGESTKKSSVNYVFIFYRAMIIFAGKHFSGRNAKLFSFIINLAIYLRAGMALISRFIKTIFLPTFDFIYLTGGLFALTSYWKKAAIEFPEEVTYYAIPIYGLVWIITSFVQGGYDSNIKLYKFFKGVILGTILILLIYGLLPKSLQFSRLFIFIGAGWAITYYLISRLFLHFAIGKKFRLKKNKKKQFVIYADNIEADRIEQLLIKTNDTIENIAHKDAINAELDFTKTEEIIFSSKSIDFKSIIEKIIELRDYDFRFKIAPENLDLLIGSNSIDTAGELYILNLNALDITENKRKKRIFDLTISFFLLVLSPFLIFTFSKKSNFLKNLLSVFIGKKSMIGFSPETRLKDVRLPKIKDGILHPSETLKTDDEAIIEKLNLLYTRDYSMRKDFSIVLRSWNKLDN